MRLPADAPSRAVSLTISRTWNMYCVTCRNDADPATIHRQGDRFLSSKDQPGLHGYGTESIRSAVEATGGVCRFMVKDHSFTAELWLPEERGQ